MKDIINRELCIANALLSDEAKLSYLTSVFRSILQTVTLSTLELIKDESSIEELPFSYWISRLQKPTDGLPIEILDEAIPHLRRYVNTRFAYGWFESTEKIKPPLSQKLTEWVKFRNKHPGHGVVDQPTASLWSIKTSKLIEEIISVFESVIPDKGVDDLLYIRGKKVITPLISSSDAIVYSSIKQSKGIWKVYGVTLSNQSSKDISYVLSENCIFSDRIIETDKFKLSHIISDNQENLLEHNLPIRQTDMFEGRENEIESLKNWLNNRDSRRCLIYGDGGYGKTTLVLEVLNRYIEGSIEISEIKPTLLCYYTAKMTRWGINGLEHFTSITPLMDECVRELMTYFIPTLDKSWYSLSGEKLISRAVTEITNNKYTRNDILMVIDNAETLSLATHQNNDLAEFLDSIGRRLCRVIITSRRHERLEAYPIEIGGLSERDCYNLLRKLAIEYNANAIKKAGERTLINAANKLMRKPILLEALVVYIARSGIGIDAALNNIYIKSDHELLEFLYDDAWLRINDHQKKALFVIISLSCPLTEISIGRTCQIIELQHTEFLNNIKETHFVNIVDYGSSYELDLVELAKRFFVKKFSEQSDDIKDEIESISNDVSRYTIERNEIEQAYKRDRVTEAFRSDYAKIAKVAAEKGNIENAIESYELAILDDPMNSALHDRYAWLLFNKKKDADNALPIAIRACELNPDNCDAVVNLALINYRLGHIETGDKHIQKSISLGRPGYFAPLRMAIARYHDSFRGKTPAESLLLLIQAQKQLSNANKIFIYKNGYDAKNKSDIVKFTTLINKEIKRINIKIKKINAVNINEN
ncbi:hypothetical protein [Aeromonas hydrophila]|uniref:hypothetical protein n=1 Tax=Aeromonas hydrophila TaxID=644 RepID=UPI002361C7AF|nr:hypothetical protein [Aeromonas hydrophila]